MKYKELIQFDPINEVVQFDLLSDEDYRKSLVRNFVFSSAYEKTIIPELCKNLDYNAMYSTFGLQIVGNYGTGKSHLMSLFSLIAENADYLPLVQNDSARQVLGNIAGKYMIIRFELGSDQELWKIVCYQIDKAFKEWGINYSISDDDKPDMYSDKFNRMMAKFEEKFPGKGLMIVIDEMLSYLKGRSDGSRLNRDLAVLQALGQASDHSKFRMVFGVQELIYNAPEFQFAADMLGRVNDRFRQIEITKQDVQYVVQCRLLNKTDEQKKQIKQHLSKFESFFTDMHANLDEYVNLFPVNPSFFQNFQQIRVGKSQREVLKTLSKKFESILENDVPQNQPGLICYDSYWADLNTASMQTDPDVRRVSEIMSTIHQKIDENFIGARAKKATLAHRIADACAVKILQDSLEKTNGASAETLVDDLCYLDETCIDRQFLVDTVNTTANQIITSTVGQYFEQNTTNQEYHLRIEGGVNYEQKIKDYVLTMNNDQLDAHFFNFLVEYLPIDIEQYRREFKIFKHRIDWRSHKTMLDGYIFMGNPSERSTTHPELNFYIYFMPIFNPNNRQHGDEADSVYVHLDKMGDEIKELLKLYASAESLIGNVDSSQKTFYKQYKDKYVEKLKPLFQTEFMSHTEIVYQGEIQTITPQIMNGGSKEQIISNIASTLLEDQFCQALPDYPKFTLLRQPITSENRSSMMRNARMKIANPTQPNRDGEAILAGLGLMQDNQLSIKSSQYALSVLSQLDAKGEGQVLNRDEILYQFFESDWRSKDFHIDSELEFLVLSAMVACAEIEIDLPGGKNINAANLKEIVDLPVDAFFNFSHIRRPKGMNLAAVGELFMGITGKNMNAQLQNDAIYPEIVEKSRELAAKAVKASHDIANGIVLNGIEILSTFDATAMTDALKALAELCDKVPSYGTAAKMRNIPWTLAQIQETLSATKHIEAIEKMQKFTEDFRMRTNYLTQAIPCISSDTFIKEINEALNKMSVIVKQRENDSIVKAYKSELDTLANRYADLYLEEYKRMHINNIQNSEKTIILNSPEKKVCEEVCGADHDYGYFSVTSQYTEWTKKMASLTVENDNVTKESILRNPYQGFNPAQYVGKQLPTLSELNGELKDIFRSIDETMQQMFQDETLKSNIDVVLDDSEKSLVRRYTTGGEQLAPLNAARLVTIVEKLHQGIHKVDITIDSIRSVFNRPMTPDAAIKAFKQYISSLTAGGNNDNIRIILK